MKYLPLHVSVALVRFALIQHVLLLLDRLAQMMVHLQVIHYLEVMFFVLQARVLVFAPMVVFYSNNDKLGIFKYNFKAHSKFIRNQNKTESYLAESTSSRFFCCSCCRFSAASLCVRLSSCCSNSFNRSAFSLALFRNC